MAAAKVSGDITPEGNAARIDGIWKLVAVFLSAISIIIVVVSALAAFAVNTIINNQVDLNSDIKAIKTSVAEQTTSIAVMGEKLTMQDDDRRQIEALKSTVHNLQLEFERLKKQ